MAYARVMAAIAANDEAAALAAIAQMDAAGEAHPLDSPVLQALYRGMEKVPAALVAVTLRRTGASGEAPATSAARTA